MNSMLAKQSRDGHRTAVIGTNLIAKMTTTKLPYRGTIQRAMVW